MSKWTNYISLITDDGGAQIAKASGTSAATVSRWNTQNARPSAEQVIAFARSYNESPVEALIVAGYLTASETSGIVKIYELGLEHYSELELAQEVVRRLGAGQSMPNFETPLGDPINEGPGHPMPE